MKVLITICARGGSKGIPGKNIKPLSGKPLIAYTIQSAQKFAKEINGVVALSTDSLEIKKTAEDYGLFTDYLRPNKLATDNAGKIDVIEELLLFEESKINGNFDFILDLDITSPLRTQNDLHKAFNCLLNNHEALNIFSVNKASRNPYFNMVEASDTGYVRLVKDNGIIKSRQEAPEVYDMNASFYFFRRSFFGVNNESSITSKSLVFVMDHVCFDLDEPHDFIIMDIMMRENLFTFSF